MKQKSKKRTLDPGNPPLSRAQLKKFKPSREVVPHIVAAHLRSRGRPPEGEAAKVQVTLRLDPTIIVHFKALGAGWQTRINEALTRAIGSKSGSERKR